MDSEFGKILSSPLFTFIVGKTRKEITVHSQALASLSSPLDKLINGEMIEAKTHRVDWSEVTEEDTFLRLCEYAYVRDYTPPPCAHREVEPPSVPVSKLPEYPDEFMAVPAEEAPAAEDEAAPASPEPGYAYWGFQATPAVAPKAEESSSPFDGYMLPRREPKPLWDQRRWRDFETLKEQPRHDDVRREAKYAPKGNLHPREDFTVVFLGHVELYILAERYGILPLKELVKYKLATTLAKFTLCKHNVIDLVEAVELLYQNTLPGDAMRVLIIGFIVSVVDQIGASTDFQRLLAEGGDFVLDFWQALWDV